MRVRITAVTVAALLLGVVGVIAFTAAQPAEFIYAKFGVDMNADGLPDAMYDVWTDGMPGNSSEVIEVAPMPPEQQIRKVPGLTRFDNVRVRFPVGHLPAALADWHQRIVDGGFSAHDATLIITGQAGETLSTAKLLQTWPCAVRLAQTREGFRADVADEVEFAVEQCILLDGGPIIPARK